MELKFIIFTIFILGNGCLIVSGESEEELRTRSQELLTQVINLWGQFREFQLNATNTVVGYLQQNPDIQHVLAFKDASLEAHNITAYRSACIDNSLRLLSIELNTIVLEEIAQNLTGNSKYFAETAQTLRNIHKALTEDVQVEIESCLNDSDSCRINGEFIDKTEEYFQFIDERTVQIRDALRRNWAAFELQQETKDRIRCEFLSVDCVAGR